jgi:hypothetical protein
MNLNHSLKTFHKARTHEMKIGLPLHAVLYIFIWWQKMSPTANKIHNYTVMNSMYVFMYVYMYVCMYIKVTLMLNNCI